MKFPAAKWLMLLITLAGSSLAAKTVAPQKPSLGEAVRAQLIAVRQASESQDHKAVLAGTEPLLSVLSASPKELGEVELFRADALHGLHREAEAIEAARMAARLLPDRAGKILFFVADRQHELGRPREVAATLIDLAKRAPDDALTTSPKFIAALSSQLTGTGSQDVAYALAIAFMEIDYCGDDGPLGPGWLHLDAMIGLAESGRAQQARRLLPEIANAEVLLRMAIDRRFQAIWPDVEAALGPRMAKANARYIAAARSSLDADPDNETKRHAYLVTLLQTGNPAAAVAFGAPFRTAHGAFADISDSGIHVIDTLTYALADAGRMDEALKLYADLNAQGVASHPGLIETLTNEALLNIRARRFEEALAAIDRAEAVPSAVDPVNKAWLLQARACALHRLGRKDEAAAAMTKLGDRSQDSRSAYFDGLLCTENFDAAETSALARLADPDHRTGMIYALQPLPFTVSAGRRDPDKSMATATLVRRPKVQAAIEKYGRLLPEPLRQRD